jgi:hypothetical protein
VAVDKTCGELLLPFRVIELIVTSKPTTEASGASSPVTNTDADCEDGDVAVDDFDAEPQLAANRQSATKSEIPKDRFMEKLQLNRF